MTSIAIAAITCLLACQLGCRSEMNVTNFRTTTTFAIHEVSETGGVNTFNLSNHSTGDELALINPPVLTEIDITSAVVVDHNGVAGLEVEVGALASRSLSAATDTKGKQIAFVVNGTIVSAPVVNSRINQKFIVSGSLSKSEWQKLVR